MPLVTVELNARKDILGQPILWRIGKMFNVVTNILRARILSAQQTGDHQMTAVLELGESGEGDRLLSRVTLRSWRLLELAPGMAVYAQVKGVALVRQRGTTG